MKVMWQIRIKNMKILIELLIQVFNKIIDYITMQISVTNKSKNIMIKKLGVKVDYICNKSRTFTCLSCGF